MIYLSNSGLTFIHFFLGFPAPGFALGAFGTLPLHDSPKLFVQTADHCIKELGVFRKVIVQAFGSTAPLILFIIKPRLPVTGYGYIERGTPNGGEFLVLSFKEKPD